MSEAPPFPPFDITAVEFERSLVSLLREVEPGVENWAVEHQESVKGPDGTYIIDATVRFRVGGLDFLVLCECKRHKRPVERQDVQVLHQKVQSTGAHKGVIVSSRGFQRGALEFAKAHGIACIKLTRGAPEYETRMITGIDLRSASESRSGGITAHQVYATENGGRGYTLLSGQRDYARSALLPASATSPDRGA